eukprot:4502957-Pyramimonas_sp.AAC.1
MCWRVSLGESTGSYGRDKDCLRRFVIPEDTEIALQEVAEKPRAEDSPPVQSLGDAKDSAARPVVERIELGDASGSGYRDWADVGIKHVPRRNARAREVSPLPFPSRSR